MFSHQKIGRFLGFFLCFAALLIVILVYAVMPERGSTHLGLTLQKNRGECVSSYVEGEVLVVFKEGVQISAVQAIAGSLQLNVEKTFPGISQMLGNEWAHLKTDIWTTEQLLQKLEKLPEVESVSPNFWRHIYSTTPNDPYFFTLWGLHNTGQLGGISDVDIDAPEAWDITTGSSSVIVAVIDSGIDYEHPDLTPNLWINPDETVDGADNDGNGYIDDIYGMNVIAGNGDPKDDNGHGTHCSGTIGASGNNGTGVVGVNWDVQIMSCKALNSAGDGTDADAITCINYIIDKKTTWSQNIVAVNASWGGNPYSAALESAINALGTAGIVFCAAAGSDGTNNDTSPRYPASYTCSNIIAVTSVDFYGDFWSNYGATSVDLGAPGEFIMSTNWGQYIPQLGDPFFDMVETGDSKWVHGGTLDSWGITNDASGGFEDYFTDMGYGNFWSDSPGVGYVHNVDSWLATNSNIDLSPYSGQTVYVGFTGGFAFDYFQTNDTAKVEISNNGGSTWSTLADLSSIFYDWNYHFIHQYYEIPETHKTANFRFRFHITTDDTDYNYFGYRNKGWIFDNIGVGATLSSYAPWSGTSMATAHVTGAVALIAAQFPGETVAQRKERILNSTAPLTSLSGKCVTGGMLNLYSALMYNAGPEINVRFGSINFADGSTRNVGTRNSSFIMGRNFTFTIDNLGSVALNLTGSPKVTLGGAHAVHFQVSQQPTSPVAAGSTTTFRLRTVRDSLPAPLPVGWEYPVSFNVNIANDDSDENPYNFTIEFTLKKNT